MTTEPITLDAFVQQHGLTMTCEPADSNPNMAADDRWNHDASHYRCVLKRGRRSMTVPFSMGSAHTKPPRIDEVLNALASDSDGANELFESWCNELGYDSDSRKAEQIFNTCRRQAKRLRQFLGEQAYDQLLYGTERL